MKTLPEFRLCERQPVLRGHGAQLGERSEFGMHTFGSVEVIRTNALTGIASEQPFVQIAFFFRGTGFDGSPGDTASSIQHPVFPQSPARAGVDAASAASATSLHGGVGTQFGIGEHDPQQQIGAQFRVNQQGVSADPSQSGFHGPGFFEQRGRIDEYAPRTTRA